MSFTLGLKSRAVVVQIGIDHFLGGESNVECFPGEPWARGQVLEAQRYGKGDGRAQMVGRRTAKAIITSIDIFI